MDFDLSSEQREIQGAAREFLESRTAELGHGAALWPELTELGWPSIAVAEEYGGLGLSLVESALVVEEHAYAIVSSPFVGSAIAVQMIERAGSAEQRATWLPRLADGTVHGCGGADLVGDSPGSGVAVTVSADRLGLVAGPVLQVAPVETIDPLRAYGRVSGDAAPMPGDASLAVAAATVLVAAELVGTASRALDESVRYAAEREQFERPIGSFQAVAHRCAEMALAVEGARSTMLHAAWACDVDPARASRAASLAKAAASEAGREVTASAIQVHGGVGFSWEAPLHLLYKRAQLSAALWGSASSHRIRLIEEIA